MPKSRVSIFTMREATAEDATYFATRLRPSDEDEVRALFDDVEAGLASAIVGSALSYVAELNGRPIILLGCAENGDGTGCPWLMATGEVVKLPGALTKVGRHYVEVFKARWPVLTNYVDQRSLVSVRWLERLGFKIHEPVALGLRSERFHPFTMGI